MALAWRVHTWWRSALFQPSRTSYRIQTHRLSSLARGRVFLEDQPVWSYYRHSYGIRTRTWSVKTVTEKGEDPWFALKVRLSSMRSMDNDLTGMSPTGRTEQLCELDQKILVLCLTTPHQGIVTKFTFEVHKQTNVWVCHLPGGCHVYILTPDT